MTDPTWYPQRGARGCCACLRVGALLAVEVASVYGSRYAASSHSYHSHQLVGGGHTSSSRASRRRRRSLLGR